MSNITIPFIDLRGKTPVDLLRAYPDKARELILQARRTWGMASHIASAVALPFADKRSHAWLKRSGNPYLHEIESMADVLGISGVYALNVSYEWGCTSGAYRTSESVSMLRVLDWPFPSLGKQVTVALQQGKAGEFYNVTWPGLSGVFTAMAPARFSVALNLAPMRRHGSWIGGDWLKNRMLLGKTPALPPSHLLRQVCETATDYTAAKAMLAKTPIAVPAIFVLAGAKPGEGCVIERLEDSAEVMELSANLNVVAANQFESPLAKAGEGWRPRLADSPGRLRQGTGITGHDLAAEDFAWLRAPIINQCTRLCVVSDAATRRLMVQGYEGSMPVTGLFNLPAPIRKAQNMAAQGTAWN